MTGMAVVYSSDCPSALKRVAADSATVWQCDGTADQVQINQAVNAVQATGQNSSTPPSGGGGAVLLVGFNFNLAAPVSIQSWVDLSGAFGRAGTRINAAGGFAGTALIQTAQTFTEYTTVHDLWLQGSGSGSEHGLYYNAQTSQTPFTYSDPVHTCRDLVIQNPGGAGIYFDTAVRVSTVEGVRIGTPGTYGVFGGGLVDSMMSDVQVLGAGSEGFHLANTDNVFANLMADNCHTNGFAVSGTRQSFSSCKCEDSTQHGWLITAGKIVLTSCTANSAGLGSSATYDGFNISSVSDLVLDGCQSYDRNGSPHQRWGVFLGGSCTYTWLVVNTYGNATGSFGGTTTPGTGSTYNVFGT